MENKKTSRIFGAKNRMFQNNAYTNSVIINKDQMSMPGILSATQVTIMALTNRLGFLFSTAQLFFSKPWRTVNYSITPGGSPSKLYYSKTT